MSWRRWFRRDDGIDEELRAHLRMAVEERVARGETETDAEWAARRELGNLTHLTEVTREQARGRTRIVGELTTDIRYGWRQLRASPALATAVILSLALGIGANTAIFSLVNIAMLKPLPVERPHELVELTVSGGPQGKGAPEFNGAMWDVLRDRQRAFAGLLAYGSTGRADLSAGGESRPIAVGLVSGGFFETLGVRPFAGRLLMDADDVVGCAGVAVLTHSFWRSEYGGDARVVGRTIAINGHSFLIAGVAEPRFFGLSFGYHPPVWMPQCAGSIVSGAGRGRGGTIVGRLGPGVSIQQARAELNALTPGLVDAAISASASGDAAAQLRRMTIGAEPFERGFRFLQMDYGTALMLLMAIVGAVLLIACANAANLLLARATARRHEFAVRAALGARRVRILRQLLTESLLLAVVAAALGLVVARAGSRLIVDLLSRQGRPVLLEVPLDGNVLLFTTVVAVVTTLLFGLAPAWRSAGADPASAMTAGRRVAEGHSRWSVTRLLVVGQIALALFMVVGAGLLLATWRTLTTMDPGFRSDGVLLVGVSARATELSPRARAAAFTRTLERLRAIPGVSRASAATRTPLGTTGWQARVANPAADTSRTLVAGLNSISDGYFATIGTPMLAGRDFTSLDAPGAPGVVILGDSTARALYGSPGAAIGRSLSVRWREDATVEYRVVGVAGNTKDHSLQEDMPPLVYFAFAQDTAPEPYMNFALHGNAGPQLAALARSEIMSEHPRFSLTTRTIRHQMDEVLRLPRTLGVLSGSFGVLALLLASLGLYGVISYGVARRRNEIGVRIALGADRGRIVRLVLGDVARMVVPGLLLGVALSVAGGKLVSAFLYGVSATDQRILASAAATLALVAFGAALLPARRAARLDPVTALNES